MALTPVRLRSTATPSVNWTRAMARLLASWIDPGEGGPWRTYLSSDLERSLGKRIGRNGFG